jgi:putative flavoprotein involved in K+ transport
LDSSAGRKSACVVIGAGHAGLAISYCLTARGIDHVVLERGEIANSWRTERWDSLRLLTPNWQSRLPGYRYQGDDPDGYQTVAEVVRFIRNYARVTDAPVQTQTRVTSVRYCDPGYSITTDCGEWRCDTVVLATGACNIAAIPACAATVPKSIYTLTPLQYRSAEQLPEGGVLIVGASATGIQLAYEIQRSGRAVTLSIGEHIRAPRLYRGRDVQWWMDASGLSDQRYDQVDDIVRARRLPSMQLVGTPERRTLDLNALRAGGAKLVGRLAGIRDGRALFSGSLRNQCALADLKLGRLLDTFDQWAREHDLDGEIPGPQRLPPTEVDDNPPLELNLGSGEIKTVIWATGYRPDYSWLHVPVLDRKQQIRHDGGVTPSPGLYVMGLPFLRRRKSAFIDGAAADAADLAAHLSSCLANPTALSR